jgi:ATP-dependent Zn protease
MATVDNPVSGPSAITAKLTESHTQLSYELRRLTRVATFVAILTSPSIYYWFHHHNGWSVAKSLILTFVAVAAFRGLTDILVRKVIPWPSLFGTDDQKLREDDIVNRRRAWTWRWFFRMALYLGGIVTIIYLVQIHSHPVGVSWFGVPVAMWNGLLNAAHNPTVWIYFVQIVFLFFANFLIFMGPLLLMGISQIKGFEPGDAEWGVKLDDVRGQAEAKEEIRRIVTLWQSGEVFEKAGGKRERGLLFNGAPGTGKTMMAKAIATGFNSPFVTIPGSGFAQTFIGIDAIIVRYLARKAKRLANKWGGQCIVFIDEIDAVGMRRQALGGGPTMAPLGEWWDPEQTFYGPYGAVNQSGDIICENEAWREWMFRMRAPEPRSAYPAWYRKLAGIVNQGFFPGMGGMGQLALNQLLVTMDGVDNPPFKKRFLTNRANSLLDAIYIVPRRVRRRWAYPIALAFMGVGAFIFLNPLLDETASAIYAPLTAAVLAWNLVIMFVGFLLMYIGVMLWNAAAKSRKRQNGATKSEDGSVDDTVSLRLPRARPTGNQIYFIGATNVPLQNLDPALTRPGRMGRHVTFRTPTKEDRKDIFDLYLGKVAHDPALDTPERRDEIARITNGYSPAMIDQICSMALTNAHHTGRAFFEWEDLVEAMTVVESGTAVTVHYVEDDALSTAVHEAGHAAAAHVYRPEVESSRISIRQRGASGGHHQIFEKEERFKKFQSMMFGDLIHTVAAMAAEFEFYGENSMGVGGDLNYATFQVSRMVGGAGMSPLPIDLQGKTFADENEEETRERILQRLEDLGLRLLNTGSIPDRRKQQYAAQLLGQAFVIAYNMVRVNHDKVNAVAHAVFEQKEIYGDALVRLLDEQNFEKPEIDWTAEETWPKIMDYTPRRKDPKENGGNAAHGDERTMLQ